VVEVITRKRQQFEKDVTASFIGAVMLTARFVSGQWMSTPANEMGFGQRTPQTVLQYECEDVQAALTIYTMLKEENLVNKLSKLTSLYIYTYTSNG
jgi:predicted transcriptional regulator